LFELVIKNGHVIDPAKNISSTLNIGVSGGKIACVSDAPLAGAETIDAAGFVVSPGFVDIHMHEDPYDAGDDSFRLCISNAMLKMGVTTAVGGNCGLTHGNADPLAYLAAVDRIGFPINFSMLAPHDCLRKGAGLTDFYKKANKKEIEAMALRLKELLEGGCLGLSLGLEYIPGTDTDEILALLSMAAEMGKAVSVHVRYDAKKSIIAVREMIDAAGRTGAALQISHVGGMCAFGQMERAISLIDSGRADGMDLEFDCYPYYAYCTAIGSAVFDDGFLEDLGLDDDSYGSLEVASGAHRGERCTKESFHAIRKAEPEALLVAHFMNEAEVDMAIRHPGCIVISDGIYSNGEGHPRGAGAFPRFIREYVVNKRMLGVEEAVRKAAYAPAKRFGLKKGTLSPGADADITIFDLNEIKDGSTYAEPVKAPDGVEYVIIGGKTALKKGHIIDGKLGKAIK